MDLHRGVITVEGTDRADEIRVDNQVTWIYRNDWEAFDRVYATDWLDSVVSDAQDRIETGPWAPGDSLIYA